jgi:hypothetical protein
LVAHIVFWLLVGWSWFDHSLSVNTRVVFLVLWFAGLFGFSLLSYGAGLFISFVAVLDIVLVFMLFGGDVRLRK